MTIANIFYFNYTHTMRFMFNHKLPDVLYFSDIPDIKKIFCYFSIKNLEELTDVRIYNYFYFFKFFFGNRAFFFGFKENRSFSNLTFDFSVQVIAHKKDIYTMLSFFACDIIPFIDVDFLRKIFYSSVQGVNYFSILDMNIFSEKKTNLGLFNLKNSLNLKIYVMPNSFNYSKLLLNSFKIFLVY